MADESRTARASALEEKRRKLEEMRARREQRGDPGSAAVRTVASSNLDEYIDGLLSAPTAAVDAMPKQKTIVATEASKDEGTSTSAPAETDTAVESQKEDNVIAVVAAPSQKAAPARQVDTFDAGTQTAQEDFPEGEQEEEELQEETRIEESKEEKEMPVSEEQDIAPKVLSPEEREEAVTSVPFSSFLNTASKKVERVLGAPILADLLVNFVGEKDGLERGAETQSDGSRFVSAQEIFDCPKWTATRDVTDMDWSPLHRELMLSSYHMPSSAGTAAFGSAALSAVSPDDTPSASMFPRNGELQSDGLVLVWSLAMPSRPEHIFACGSPVLKSRFHPTESPLIIGGCQSGQLVIWDIRAGRLPVQRSGQGHAHPICGMEIVEGGVSDLMRVDFVF